MLTILNSRGIKAGKSLATLSSGRVLKYPLNPFDSDPERIEDLPSCHRGVVEVISIISDLDSQVTALSKDARLTPAGVLEKLREPRVSTLMKFGRAFEEHVLAHAKSTDEFEAQLYKLPAFTTNNYQRERHILDLVLSAPKERHAAIHAHARSGDDEELAVALIRAPKVFDALFDGQVSGKSMRELGVEAWRSVVNLRNPEEAQRLRLSRDISEWATGVFKQFARDVRGKDGVDLLGPELRADWHGSKGLTGAAVEFFS